jgi:phosphatidyl-myo-inositol dimannoside synthase
MATLAAITLHPKGGGVAAVSRLLWRVFVDRWRDDADLETLVGDQRGRVSIETTTGARLAFGARIASRQMTGRSPWIFFSHVSVAQVQRFVPAPFRCPYAVFIHGIEAWRPLSEAQRRVIDGAVLRVANSRFTARRVREAHEGMSEILPCPLALSPEFTAGLSFDAVAAGPRGSADVLVVGRMVAAERYKGHDELLDAWPEVRRRVPDARLVFVGDGDDAVRLGQKAADLGVATSVRFEGFVSDDVLQALYRRAAVLAMPSRGEGFGLVYLEAMAHGLPCIGSIHDAAGEVIEDGVTGFLVDQEDTRTVADRIVTLLTDEPRRRQMGAEGRRRLEGEFSYEAFGRRMLALIDGAFGAPAGATSHGARGVL